VSELGGGFRCVVPTWPLVAHSTPTDGADIGAEATARRIVHFIEALDLRDVTVVANDTGGGLVLAALGDATLDKSRIGRLVLTNCDSYEHFPPAWDDTVYPDGVGAWMAKLDADLSAGGLVPDNRFFPHGDDFRVWRCSETPPRSRSSP
jgi:pimeloyl-ACP methyl ester carboxylesterase